MGPTEPKVIPKGPQVCPRATVTFLHAAGPPHQKALFYKRLRPLRSSATDGAMFDHYRLYPRQNQYKYVIASVLLWVPPYSKSV